jgi:uncharacterized protein (DUF433 family)
MSVAEIPSLEKAHITRTAGVCGGKACIAGSRVRVLDIYVWHDLQGASPDEIVSRHPQLTLGDVYAALAWIWDHREQVLADLAREHQVSEEMRSRYPSKIQPKLVGVHGPAIPS